MRRNPNVCRCRRYCFLKLIRRLLYESDLDPAHLFGYWLTSEINYNINVNHLLEDYYWATP